jgi:hypothetical protein
MLARLQRSREMGAFLLLVVIAEVVGRSLTTHLDRRLHVNPLASTSASYYPFLLVAVKIAGALVLAALLARLIRLRAATDAGERLLAAAGRTVHRAPRWRLTFSARVWAASFVSMASAFLVQTNGERLGQHRFPALDPWLHTYALPVYALLAVVVAVAWGVRRWLDDIEEHVIRTLGRARRMLGSVPLRLPSHTRPGDDGAPRRRFGLSLDSRPPPLTA